MKELKDFIHLYVGQFVYIFPDETLTNGWLQKKLIELPGLRWKLEVTPDTLAQRIIDNYKLILRPLSSITEEEAKQYARLKGYKDDYIQDFKFVEKGFEFGTEGRRTFLCLVPPYGDSHKPNQFVWLLKNGFDLFDLRAAGVAVYEEDLKTE
jgi:hypothetical protein